MTDREKLGVRVDAEVLQQFREDVEERKGQKRGVLGDEVEKALKHYLAVNNDLDLTDRLARIERGVRHLEQEAELTPADGGTDTSETPGHTHAPSRVDAATEERPAANAATDKKVAYLAAEVKDREGGGGTPRQVPRDHIVDIVKDEYGFRRDTAKRYVGQLIDYFGYVDHPTADGMLVLPDVREEMLADQRDRTRDDASDRMEDLTNE